MSIQGIAYRGAAWLSLFKLISQAFSWAITVVIARILFPSDYGLMAIATIITGYAAYFSDLGLGAAVIQKKDVTEKELSSIFWFIFVFSLFLAAVCFIGAYYIGHLFNEPKVVPLIQVLSFVFPLNSLQLIQLNLMKRNLEFKKVGYIGMVSTIISCSCMYLIASSGGGVWTLVSGFFISSVTSVIFVHVKVKWRPQLHFSYQEAKSYFTFGTNVFVGRTFFYIFESSDKFFAGRVWTTQMLGYYSFALQLAQIPTEKISSLINQVSFPVFSKLQHDSAGFNKFYLNVLKATSVIVLPVFVGGYCLGEDLIKILLNEKWYPIVDIFKLLCLSQIITSLNAINSFVHYSQGRPHWSLYFHIVLAVVMATSFYFAVQHGLKAILIPWFTSYTLLCGLWIYITLNKIGIKISDYFKNILSPITATFIMFVCVTLSDYFLGLLLIKSTYVLFLLIIKIVVGVLSYVGYFWVYDRDVFHKINELRK